MSLFKVRPSIWGKSQGRSIFRPDNLEVSLQFHDLFPSGHQCMAMGIEQAGAEGLYCMLLHEEFLLR